MSQILYLYLYLLIVTNTSGCFIVTLVWEGAFMLMSTLNLLSLYSLLRVVDLFVCSVMLLFMILEILYMCIMYFVILWWDVCMRLQVSWGSLGSCPTYIFLYVHLRKNYFFGRCIYSAVVSKNIWGRYDYIRERELLLYYILEILYSDTNTSEHGMTIVDVW